MRVYGICIAGCVDEEIVVPGWVRRWAGLFSKGDAIHRMERLLNTKDAAWILNVSQMTIRRWTDSGKLKCYRVGGKQERRFRMEHLQEFLRPAQYDRWKSLGAGRHKGLIGSHMAHFYTGEQEAFDVSLPYLLEGVERGERLLAVMPPRKSAELLADMDRRGYPVAAWLKTGQLRVSAGMESLEGMVRYIAAFAAEAGGFRVVGDMIWSVEKGWDLTTLSSFENIPSTLPPSENGALLCQYSLQDLSGSYIMMASEHHRHIIYKGKMRSSQYYDSAAL